jgi:hypothetical protein
MEEFQYSTDIKFIVPHSTSEASNILPYHHANSPMTELLQPQSLDWDRAFSFRYLACIALLGLEIAPLHP